MPFKDKAVRTQYDLRYAKEHKRRIALDVRKEYFEDIASKIPEKTGLPINTFIKQAIAEKIIRDDIDLPIGKYL